MITVAEAAGAEALEEVGALEVGAFVEEGFFEVVGLGAGGAAMRQLPNLVWHPAEQYVEVLPQYPY